MKIAITGAGGIVGRHVVKLCSKSGYSIVQINQVDTEPDGTPNSEMRTADMGDYKATVESLRGCDALIHLAAINSPIGRDNVEVHQNNVQCSFNGFRACGELGIKRICYASSVNAIGLVYSNQPSVFPYFPIDEDYPPNPTDPYSLAKLEGEIQAKSFANWFPGTKIACLRIHQVAPKAQVRKEEKEKWELGVKNLWGWVHPDAAARACLLSVENANNIDGCQVFNITASESAQERLSRELAQEFYPKTEIRGSFPGNQSFWNTDKAKRILGWRHDEKE